MVVVVVPEVVPQEGDIDNDINKAKAPIILTGKLKSEKRSHDEKNVSCFGYRSIINDYGITAIKESKTFFSQKLFHKSLTVCQDTCNTFFLKDPL